MKSRPYYCRARHNSEIALKQINDITAKYSTCPDSISMTEEEISWLNEKIRILGECVKQTNYRKFNFYEDFRHVRNELAHIKEMPNPAQTYELWQKIFNWLDVAKNELIANIKRTSSPNKTARRYEKFSSSKEEDDLDRKQLVDAIDDSLNPNLSVIEKVSYPDVMIAKQTKKIFEPENIEQKELFSYAQKHDGLHDSILTDIVDWIKTTKDTLYKENPFEKETQFIHKVTTFKFSYTKLIKDVEKLHVEYNDLPTINPKTLYGVKNGNVDFDFYEKKIKNVNTEIFINNQDFNTHKEKKALIRNLCNDIVKSYTERKNSWEIEQIGKMREQFIKDLYEKISRFKKIEELLSPFIDDLGYLWDLSNSPFHDNGFEILQQYADLLESDEFLKELAKLLGRQGNEQTKYEKELRDKIEIVTDYEMKPAYRGEVTGLRLSNDIATVIPSELAMYKNLATKKYFMFKFVQKKLLSYSYERDTPYTYKKKTQEEVEIEIKENETKGPIIICVDTSGSMHGAPERIAKTISFALSKIAISENRKCYLISFSTGISTLDLSSFQETNALEKLVSFLRMSFNGGTDAAPALTHAVELLQKENWQNSDVLMVSDFIMGTFSEELNKKIEQEQNRKTGFYSLVIGNDGNTQTIKSFDDNWNYNPSDINAQKKLVQQLDSLKNRKNRKNQKDKQEPFY